MTSTCCAVEKEGEMALLLVFDHQFFKLLRNHATPGSSLLEVKFPYDPPHVRLSVGLLVGRSVNMS